MSIQSTFCDVGLSVCLSHRQKPIFWWTGDFWLNDILLILACPCNFFFLTPFYQFVCAFLINCLDFGYYGDSISNHREKYFKKKIVWNSDQKSQKYVNLKSGKKQVFFLLKYQILLTFFGQTLYFFLNFSLV